MKKKKQGARIVSENDFIMDYFSKIKTTGPPIKLDFSNVEKEVNSTFKNIYDQKNEELKVDRTDTEKEFIEKENDLKNLGEKIFKFAEEVKRNQKKISDRNKFLKDKEAHHQKYFNPLNFNFNEEQILSNLLKKHDLNRNSASRTPDSPLLDYRDNSFISKEYSISGNNKSGNSSLSPFAKIPIDKRPFYYFKPNFKSIEIDDKGLERVRGWEEFVLNPLNHKHDVKSTAVSQLNKLRSLTNLKQTYRSIKKGNRSVSIDQGAEDVVEILNRIDLLSRVKLSKHQLQTNKIPDLISAQRKLLNISSKKYK